MPKLGFIHPPQPARLTAGVEPVRNTLNTLFLIADCNDYPGVHPFVTQTHAGLDPETRQMNETIMIGLCYASRPEEDYPTFPQYIEGLKKTPPKRLQDMVMHSYDRISAYKVNIISDPGELTITAKDQERLLSSRQIYLEYLQRCFGHEGLDLDIEGRAYEFLIRPEKMKEAMISHFEYMWEHFLKSEFERNKPVLEKVVEEYHRLDFSKMTPLETAKRITGHDLEREWAGKKWEIEWIEKSKKVVFVPSMHMGPYLGRKLYTNAVCIFFSPKSVDGFELSIPEATHTDISLRLTTLGDDVRLQILKMLAKAPELSSKQIMDAMGLTQSSASRHLKQLSVTGFLNERRQHSAKLYSLNRAFVSRTMEAVLQYLDV